MSIVLKILSGTVFIAFKLGVFVIKLMFAFMMNVK